jgi:hypothetical protein
MPVKALPEEQWTIDTFVMPWGNGPHGEGPFLAQLKMEGTSAPLDTSGYTTLEVGPYIKRNGLILMERPG